MRDRFWIRGWTPLGLLNSVLAVIAGIVLVRVVTSDCGKVRTVAWSIDPAEKHPRPSKGGTPCN